MSTRFVFFATCAPGLEPVLHAEARALRLARVERQVGGVYFEGPIEDAWRANLELRTAVRVLLRVARFPARDADELYRGAARVEWRRFLRPDGTLFVDAQSRESELFHTHFVQQRVKDAVVDGFRTKDGVRPWVDADDADLRIHVHLFRDRATLSVDTSGGSLHKRGWRRYQGRAPLAETMAAAVVLMSSWDRRSPFVDPFCGSGTVAIEAAAIAARVPTGRWRSFGFERWPDHDASAFERLREAANARTEWPRKLAIHCSDADPDQVQGALENAASAGFGERLRIECADARELAPKRGWNAWMASNPPYGVRVGEGRDLASLYRDFGELLRARCAGFHVAFLLGDPEHARALGLESARHTRLLNGAIECELVRALVPDGARTSSTGAL